MRTIKLSTPLGTDASGGDMLQFLTLEGVEAMSTLFDYTLTAQSTNPDIDRKSLVGKSVSISIEDQYLSTHYLNAVVSAFKRKGRRDNYTIYEAKLSPWLALTRLRRDCKIFYKQSAADIVCSVLSSYPFKIKLRLSESYAPLLREVQYNESDFAFVSRVLESAGIGYYFVHDADTHTLVLSDSLSSFDTVPGHDTIPFSDQESTSLSGNEEVIRQWAQCQTIKSGKFITSDYDYRQPSADLQESNADERLHAFDGLDVFHWEGQGDYKTGEAGANIAKIRLEQQRQEIETVEAESDVRALALGATGRIFTLSDHPLASANQSVLILRTQTLLKENPSVTAQDGEHTDWKINLVVMPSKLQYRPQRRTPLPRIYGPQTGVVVAPSAKAEAWVNDLGEVLVRMPWDRYYSGVESALIWVRVSSGWAGNGYGELMVPRVGTEVIISFLDGHPAHPVITGRVVNASNLPPSFSDVGNLPSNYHLAGIKSKEFSGGGHGQLLFDDSPGEIRTQLASSHGNTQLNLGFLTYPRYQGSATPRGQGFEIRSDMWGSVRASSGLQVTTYAQRGANGEHLDSTEATGQLDAALSQAKAQSDTAVAHSADELTANDSLAHVKEMSAQQAEQGSKSVAGYKEPILVLSSPVGIAQASQKALVAAAGTDIHQTSQRHTNLSVGRRLSMTIGEAWSVFVEKAGMKLFAGKGKVQIQAQSDNVELVAQKDLLLHSVDQIVEVVGTKGILLTSGGAYIRIADGNIEIHAPGSISQKGASHSVMGPTSLSKDLPALPKSESKANEFFVLVNRQTGEPIANRRYKATTESGQVVEGVSDAQGKTQLVKGEKPESVQIKVFPSTKT